MTLKNIFIKTIKVEKQIKIKNNVKINLTREKINPNNMEKKIFAEEMYHSLSLY